MRPSWVWLWVSVVAVGCGGGADPSDGGGGADGAAGACETAADCDDGVFCNGAEACDPSAGGDGCVAGAPPCAGTDVCAELEDRCVSCDVADEDGDGFDSVACGGDDCDDADAGRFPGNAEVCDALGVDEDCDPSTLGPDLDGDGHVGTGCCNEQPDGSSLCGGDCDDTRSGINPETPEACNDVDEDCDGFTDEGVTTTCSADADNDGYAPEGAETREQCTSCTETDNWASAPRFPSEIDCDDGDATVNPGATELCDGIDSDCSHGGVSPAPDEDGDEDGYASTTSTCSGGPLAKLDCNDRDARARPNQSQYAYAPHCAGGAPIGCRLPGGAWSCSYPRRTRSEECDTAAGAIPGAATPSWDFDCNGEPEPEPAMSGCACTIGVCGEPPVGSGARAAGRARAPEVTPTAADCGRGVAYRECVPESGGSCGIGAACLYRSITSPDYVVSCR